MKKPKTGYFRIIHLFPSCFSVSGVNQKHEGKYNRTSSDPGKFKCSAPE